MLNTAMVAPTFVLNPRNHTRQATHTGSCPASTHPPRPRLLAFIMSYKAVPATGSGAWVELGLGRGKRGEEGWRGECLVFDRDEGLCRYEEAISDAKASGWSALCVWSLHTLPTFAAAFKATPRLRARLVRVLVRVFVGMNE